MGLGIGQDMHSRLAATLKQLNLGKKVFHAADESGGSMKKKLEGLGVPDTAENRIAFRGALMTTPGYQNIIGGTILFDETLRQKYEGQEVPSILKRQQVVIGVKVDSGLTAFSGSEIEQVGKNFLDDLPERLKEYWGMGVGFLKARVVANIGLDQERRIFCPTDACLKANATLLAMYAVEALKHGIIPIVEPEVDMAGTHNLLECQVASTRFLQATFNALKEHDVYLPGVILKTNMVLPGKNCTDQSSLREIARANVITLSTTLPAGLGGAVYLSGDQTSQEAMDRLLETRACAKNVRGLPGSFIVPGSSFSRALQREALQAFAEAVKADKSPAEIKAITQAAFKKSLQANARAMGHLEVYKW